MLSVPDLVKTQIDFIKKYSICINIKITDKEYTKRIGLLLGVNLQYGSTRWHHRNLENLYNLEPR